MRFFNIIGKILIFSLFLPSLKAEDEKPGCTDHLNKTTETILSVLPPWPAVTSELIASLKEAALHIDLLKQLNPHVFDPAHHAKIRYKINSLTPQQSDRKSIQFLFGKTSSSLLRKIYNASKISEEDLTNFYKLTQDRYYLVLALEFMHEDTNKNNWIKFFANDPEPQAFGQAVSTALRLRREKNRNTLLFELLDFNKPGINDAFIEYLRRFADKSSVPLDPKTLWKTLKRIIDVDALGINTEAAVKILRTLPKSEITLNWLKDKVHHAEIMFLLERLKHLENSISEDIAEFAHECGNVIFSLKNKQMQDETIELILSLKKSQNSLEKRFSEIFNLLLQNKLIDKEWKKVTHDTWSEQLLKQFE